mgnify:CR=1 FL=1
MMSRGDCICSHNAVASHNTGKEERSSLCQLSSSKVFLDYLYGTLRLGSWSSMYDMAELAVRVNVLPAMWGHI